MAQPLRTNSPMTSIDTKVIEVELNELRHHLEQEVKKRTEQLTRCITLLESCNATLCDKLELARTELAALKQQLAVQVVQPDPVAQTNDGDMRSDNIGKPIRSLQWHAEWQQDQAVLLNS